MFLMNSVQVPQTKMLTAVPRGARTQVFSSFGSAEGGPDADIPPYADTLGSGSHFFFCRCTLVII